MMNRLLSRIVDPYQVLFPLGVIHSIVGASVWILFALNRVTYPGQTHPFHMVDGFLLSFAAGFLMTAIPRFTGAARCTKRELSTAALLSITALFVPHPLLTLCFLIFIAFFFLRRFLARSFTPPPHFLFIPIGLLLGILGSSLMTLMRFELIDLSYSSQAKTLLYYGMMLSFLLGIGARLISALLGWSALPHAQVSPLHGKPKATIPWMPLTQAALFLTSFGTEIFLNPSVGRGLRAICATWIGLQHWRLHRCPQTSGKMPFWIWTSGWVLLLGLWTHAFFPMLGIHAAHLIFMGGFGLITLMVASRVTLAHGGHPLELEVKSRIYAATAALIFLATVTRFVSYWTPFSLFHHFAYAAALWILALSVWCWFFLPKMLPKALNK